MSITKEDIDSITSYVLGQLCNDNWQQVCQYYGEDASELDFLMPFDYRGVYNKGDLKECMVFVNIAIIQANIISHLFDFEEHEEAFKTHIAVTYMRDKLFDKATGVNEHTWIN